VPGIVSDTGATGAQGFTGATGATGARGAQGFTGETGLQGYTGAQGFTGFTGAQGLQGFTGETGATGAQGFTGETGAQGMPGIASETGATGAQGFTGETGATGARGAQGFTGETGSQGFTGAQGYTGETGAQGLQGFTGETGSQGFTGATGAQGLQGFTGETGSQGFTGETGAQGFTGAQGEQGTPGIDSDTGATGAQGFTGATGATGAQGLQGFTGATGTQGAQGFTGATGAQGFTGATGAQGPTGPVGSSVLFQSTTPYSIGASPTGTQLTIVNNIPPIPADYYSFGATGAYGGGGNVYTIESSTPPVVYTGGDFTTFDGNTVGMIVATGVTGTYIGDIDGGFTYTAGNSVTTILNSGSIYAGGKFTSTTQGETAYNISRYNGSHWVRQGSGPTGGVSGGGAQVNTLAAATGAVLLGGDFQDANGIAMKNIAELTISQNVLSAVQDPAIRQYGASGTVNAVAYDSSYIYIGGNFSSVAGTKASNIARYDRVAAKWEPLAESFTYLGNIENAEGTSGEVNALWLTGSYLFVGGNFQTVNNGHMQVDNIARWEPAFNKWQELLDTSSPGLFVGVNGPVYAITSNSNFIYVGGAFTSAGSLTVSVSNVARWNSSSQLWTPLDGVIGGSGVSGTVYSLYVGAGSNLYIGGNYEYADWPTSSTIANNISYFNITFNTWNVLIDSGGQPGVLDVSFVWTNANVYAISSDGTNLYLGGDFIWINTGSGFFVANNIVIYTSSSVWDYTTLIVPSTVRALDFNGTSLYVGGLFGTVGSSVSSEKLAQYNFTGSAWNTNIHGVGSGNVYAVKFDTTNSIIITGGTNLTYGVEVHGLWTTGSNVPINNVAAFDPNTSVLSWNPLAETRNPYGVNGIVLATTTDSTGNIYVGGTFTSAGGITANNIAVYKTDNKWYALTDSRTKLNGVNGTVRALTWSGGNLWVGGSFTYISENIITANHIATYDTANDQWIPIIDTSNINGVNGTVYALQLDNVGNIYAGGSFSDAGGTTSVNNVALYDVVAKTWSQLFNGSTAGVDGTVYAFAYNGLNTPYPYLYVGGAFVNAGGSSANYVARWDTGAFLWDNLNGGVGAQVNALAFSTNSGYLYIGGIFTSPFNYLTYYDTTFVYQQMVNNNDLNAQVNALTYNSSTQLVYIGGTFTRASIYNSGPPYITLDIGKILTFDDASPSKLVDTIPSSGVAAIQPLSLNANGVSNSSWLSGTVYAVTTTTTGTIIVGGEFTQSYDLTTPYAHLCSNVVSIPSTTGAWTPMSSDIPVLNGIVNTIVVDGNDYYVGGEFTAISTTQANYMARWNTTNKLWYPIVTRQGFISLGDGTSGPNEIYYTSNNNINLATGSIIQGTGINYDYVTITAITPNSPVSGQTTITVSTPNGLSGSTTGQTLYVYGANGVNNNVLSFSKSGTNIYVGGIFTGTSQATLNYIALLNKTLNPSIFVPITYSTDVGVNGVVVNVNVNSNNTKVYIGGLFTNTPNNLLPFGKVAQITSNVLSQIINVSATRYGVNGDVYSMASSPLPNKYIYMGGSFISTVSNTAITLNNIAYFLDNITYIPLIINGTFIDTEDSPPSNNTIITLPSQYKQVTLISSSLSPSVWLVGYRSSGVTVT
jgi:hypothetical protein